MKTTQKMLFIFGIVAALCALMVAVVSAEPEAPNALLITKTVSPTVIYPDYTGVLTYTIRVTNTTTGPLVPVGITDTLPTYLSFGAWIQQPTTGMLIRAGDTFTWTGNVAYGSPVQLVFTAKLPGPETMRLVVAEGQIVNTAYVGRLDGTVILPGSSASATTQIRLYYIYLPLVMRNFAP